MSTVVKAIRLADVAFFLRGTELIRADEDDILEIDDNPLWGRRDIDARSALAFVQAGRAVPCAYGTQVVSGALEGMPRAEPGADAGDALRRVGGGQ